ncbi:MAG: transglycosylase domain-containing protein [Actinomycetota bacterium]
MNARLLFAEVRDEVKVDAGIFLKASPWAALGVLPPLLLLGFVGWLGTIELPQASVAAQSSKVLAAGGEVIATLHGEQNRTDVPLGRISPKLIDAVVATEDRSFYEHSGVSFRGIMRALRANLEGKQIVQGGSTITQQYVRNAYPEIGTERTVARKMRESALSVLVEQRASKSQILERYLNRVYFGRGAYGAEAAAQTYFKVPASDLTVGQSAYLAGVIRSPERYQIGNNPTEAVRIRNKVIDDMVLEKHLTPAEAALARAEDLGAQFKPGMSIEVDSSRAGYFVEYVRQLMRREFKLTDEQILSGGLRIETTLDLRMQDAAERAISSVLDSPEDPEAALVAMDGRGNVRAMVGGRDVTSIERMRGFNFAVDIHGTGGGRPAGSAFKTFALAALLEQGKSVASTFPGPSQIKLESPQCRNADGTPWEVSNFANSGFGSLDVTRATLSSVNTVYAQIMDQVVSPAQFISMAAKTGIEIPRFDAGCALTLGTTDVTPMEMARAYVTFAQRGERPDPVVITRITDFTGKVIAQRSQRSERVMEQNVADTVNYVLERNVQSGTGTGSRIGRPAAGKTGTTQNHENAWYAGYTPDLAAVVWMGYAPGPDGKIPLMQRVRGRSVTGGSFPATIWKKFMAEAVEGTEPSRFVKPKLGGEVVRSSYSGGLAEEAIPGEEQPSDTQTSGDGSDPAGTGSQDLCGTLRKRSCPVAVAAEPQAEEKTGSGPSRLRSAEEIAAEVRRSIEANRSSR